MKIIDIFNKIASGEEVKFKILDEQLEYYCKKDDFLRDRNNQEVEWWLDSLWLNKEVEIIEEEKKIPEKLGLIKYSEDPATSLIHHKVDEIIDYLDYLKSKGE